MDWQELFSSENKESLGNDYTASIAKSQCLKHHYQCHQYLEYFTSNKGS